MDLPIKVNGIVYFKGDNTKILLLKRSPEDGGFWQTLTGTLVDGERVIDCLKRELQEETGISEVVNVTDEIFRFGWQNKSGQDNIDMVFGIQVKPNQKVLLSHEHTEYRWLEYDQAFEHLEKENLKHALQAFKQKVL